MNRLNLMVAGLALVVLAACTQSGEAGEKKKPRKSQPLDVGWTMSATATKACNVVAEDPIVQELVAIMNETKSPQTLLAVTLALMPMGKKAQSAVPAIMRNAERLKVFDALKDMTAPKAENATIIITAVMAIQVDLPVTRDMLGFPGSPFGQDRPSAGLYAPLPACPVAPPAGNYPPLPVCPPGATCPAIPLTGPCPGSVVPPPAPGGPARS